MYIKLLNVSEQSEKWQLSDPRTSVETASTRGTRREKTCPSSVRAVEERTLDMRAWGCSGNWAWARS